MTKKLRWLFIVGSLSAAGASHAETQTKSWYLAHPHARARVMAVCQDNPGMARQSAACITAAAAEEEAGINGMLGRSDHITTLFDQCATMPPLFQVVNHCGPAGKPGHE